MSLLLLFNPSPPPPQPPSDSTDDTGVAVDLGFGVDLDFVEDLPLNDQLASGLKNLGNALARRLIASKGSLSYDTGYGIDIRDSLGEGLTPAELVSLVASIEQELESDERVVRAVVTNRDTAQQGDGLVLNIKITTAVGPFTLILSATALTVEVLEVTT